MIKTNHYTIAGERLSIHELIGLSVRVSMSKDAGKKNVHGMVVDETQRTFTIETKTGEKNMPKNENTFVFDLNGELVELSGNELMGNPIERLKNGGKNYV